MMSAIPQRRFTDSRVGRGAIYFAVANVGWVAFAAAGFDEPFWEGGKGLVALMTGVPVLFLTSLIYALMLNWSTNVLTAPRKVQMSALCVSAFTGGASLFVIFIGLSNVALSVPALAVGDGTRAADVSLLVTPIACALLTAVLTRILVHIGQWLVKRHGA